MADSATASPGLNGAWSAYRTWAATAHYYRRAIDRYNRASLTLAVVGAVLAAAGQQMAPDAAKEASLWLRAPGMLGAAIIALSGYYTAQALSGRPDRLWMRCRAAAESIKSVIYLCRAEVAPFDTQARGEELRARVEKTLQELRDVTARASDPETSPQALGRLGVQEYLTERVQGQVDWYRLRASKYQTKSDRLRGLLWALGAVSILLGLFSAMNAVSVWAAVVATVTTSIAAFAKNQRYQALIGTYQSTATRLELLRDEWEIKGKTDADKADRDAFIHRCEATLALENSAWVALLAEQPQGATKSSATAESNGAAETKNAASPPAE